MNENVELTKGWYWVLTCIHKKLAVRYYSGKHWKFHPGEYTPLRPPFLVIERIAEPAHAQHAPTESTTESTK